MKTDIELLQGSVIPWKEMKLKEAEEIEEEKEIEISIFYIKFI